MDKKQPHHTLIHLCKAAGILLLLFSTATVALDRLDNPEQELLEPEQAFAFSAAVQDDSTLQASWKIADG